MFINTISESKYRTFKQCRLKYRYKYIDRYAEDEGGFTDPLHFGSYIHKILEEGVKATTLGELEKIAKEVLPNYKFGKAYDGKTEICIKNFLKLNASLNETVGTELVYDLEVKDGIHINGVIDRVIKGMDGGYLVIDYKTSKREKSKIDLFQDTQMKGYCYAVHQLFNVPINEITVAHYYPLTDNLVAIKYTSTQIRAYLKTIVEEVWKIRKMKKVEFCAVKNEFCNWCSYQQICPEYNDSIIVEGRLKNRKPAPRRKR